MPRLPFDQQAKVSVIVPPRNRCRLLRRALGSVREQTYRNLEIIVVDDASSDDTAAMLARFADPDLRVIGGAIVPMSFDVSRNWVNKGKLFDVEDMRFVEAERAYVRDNPHAGLLQPVFELAGIDYGRVDYAMPGGRLQVFEINTNPMIEPADRDSDLWRPAAETALANYEEAWRAVDEAAPAAGWTRLGIRDLPPRPRRLSVRALLLAVLRGGPLLAYENRIFGALGRLRAGQGRRNQPE